MIAGEVVRFRDHDGEIRQGRIVRYVAGAVHLYDDRSAYGWSHRRVLPVESLLVGGQEELAVAGVDSLPRSVVKSALGGDAE